MSIEGELVVRVRTEGGRVRLASASAERPRVAGKLFAGRTADDAPALAGALFALCGRSQSIASACAVEAARGEAPREARRGAREIRLSAETVHEHAWRLLVDWPRLAGLDPDVEGLARARRVLAPLLACEEGANAAPDGREALAWAGKTIFGLTPGKFLAFDTLDELLDWTRTSGTAVASLAGHLMAEFGALGASPVPLLARGEDAFVSRELGPALATDPRFEDEPNWYGEARETGPIARTADHPLVAGAQAAWGRALGARVVARLVDLALALQAFSDDGVCRHGAAGAGRGSGLGWVETARGLLVHRVTLERDRISGYRIVAPTEWNFHPRGAFTRGALGIAAPDEAGIAARVRWLVASLDPCVGVRLEVGHA